MPPRHIPLLNGRAPSKPRGRHAVACSDDNAAPERDAVASIPVNRRLGFRVAEFAALIGVSDVTVWRGIKSGAIEVIDQGGIKIVPRRFAVAKGFIDASDTI
jgi:hypothetical protein